MSVTAPSLRCPAVPWVLHPRGTRLRPHALQAPGVRFTMSLCSCSQEPSPDNERALHTSFHQLILEQSSLIKAGLELELQERDRGKALQPQPGQAGDSVCAQGHPLALTLLGPAVSHVSAVAKAFVGAC